MMDIPGFIVKVLLVLNIIMFCAPRFSRAVPSEKPTHLMPVNESASTNLSSTEHTEDETDAQESVKIENRQLYEAIKHSLPYDHNSNSVSKNSTDDYIEKQNSSVVKILPRNSAVIQAIPRKVRGHGNISSTTSASVFTRPTTYHIPPKDGRGEPTTTLVYATSIPTSPSRTYVNIRPIPLSSTPKYRSVVPESQNQKDLDIENTKPVIEHYTDDQPQEQELRPQLNVLEKPVYKIESQSMPTPSLASTSRSYEPTPYHVDQRKRNLYKNVPYARIRTNEDTEKSPAYNRNGFVNPYSNHKWTNEDFIPRMTSPSTSTEQFMYENQQNQQRNYFNPVSPPQLPSARRYSTSDDYYQDEMYSPVYVPQQPQAPISKMYPQQQQQQQQYQPLTVRDFDLLLQLLVLREQRLHASPEPYPLSNDYNNNGIEQDNNFFYDNRFYKNRQPNIIENSIPRSSQPSNTRLLPSNVREELLFRMLLLALHLQPQPKTVPRSPPILPSHYMYLGPSSSTAAPAAYNGYREPNGVLRNPIRSVQVLGEIE